MTRVIYFVYGVVAYAAFFVTITYAIGFVANVGVPKGIDDGIVGESLQGAAIVNVLLLAAFAVQHAIMARPAFKRWWTQYVPQPIERSTFVLIASGILLVAFWQWRPMPDIVWDIEQPIVRGALWGVYCAGWAMVFYASFLIDHFDLFGLRQVFLHLRGLPYSQRPFMERSVYKLVRHPLMLGFLMAFWAAPTMSLGRLLFAAVTTAYIFLGTRIEERDLVRLHGQEYQRYRQRTAMFFPGLPPRRAARAQSAVS